MSLRFPQDCDMTDDQAERVVSRLSEIEARAAKATPGPWYYGNRDVYIGSGLMRIPLGSEVEACDGDFIAHARDDVPHLLGRLREAQEALTSIAECDENGCSGCCGEAREALAALEKP